ncbi:NhaP-type Na+/H+ and K+/H+ antiporter [Weissella oryzae SG25]|uniref:NhaP-type Na+/H+ and K+/H+ antiporter n=1 Tax=Weissella oryzae (strain DSM 25784 / JCM 18191 / LMG 30913 / SG25) TaxID=1329250 RepID=A0A069D0L6_WEIOS|nr:sodium:proton antiporter [Weissella oryzae]GAK30856.1 NhaP-type Na+/H+ and K+/H+ antiporter [Weissella oryzae SG25]
MQTFYTVALLLVGIILTNIIKQFLPKIPEAFILITIGVMLSLTPFFKNFELQPEFFLLVIIAPIMFIDGQKQSFTKIKQRFSVIFLLSVILALVSTLIFGLLTNIFETGWTLPLAIALAAIVTPTDAVAVKSLTGNTDMPGTVGEALELESLFNDATGLVILDLALAVLSKGRFSLLDGLVHFLFVAAGGVLVGIIAGFLIVSLRVNLNLRTKNPETTVIPISLLTPFIVYLLAERLGVSGIIAVVATGIVHNWETSRLRLTSTRVQLTSTTIWETISNVLNSIVFLILGVSLPAVWKAMQIIGTAKIIQIVGVSLLIYLAMLSVRFLWSVRQSRSTNDNLLGAHDAKQHRFFASIFAISGVHGTVTLAMAFSLPSEIAGHSFPFREELIIIATLVILISMLVSAVVLPIILPAKETTYSLADINHIRNKMVDFATLQIRDLISEHDVRDALTEQLQSQKGNHINQVEDFRAYQRLLYETKDFMLTYIHGPSISQKYSAEVVNIYEKVLDCYEIGFSNRKVHLIKYLSFAMHKYGEKLHHEYKHAMWHIQNGQITPHQRKSARKAWLANQSVEVLAKRRDIRDALLELNTEVINASDLYIDDVLRARLVNKLSDNDHINFVRQAINKYSMQIRHDYSKNTVYVDSNYYIQAFQQEYNFIQRGINSGYISPAMAAVLYDEINQAQTLQLQRVQQVLAITA